MTEFYSAVALDNPKSPANVGAVLRAAGCFAVDAVFYTGTRYATAQKFHTDTHSALESISLRAVNSLTDAVTGDAKIVCIEFAEGAQSLFEFSHPAKACYFFGAEDGTLQQSTIDSADAVVFIPTQGCLNLAASVNVVLYDRFAKLQHQSPYVYGDEQILQNRDRNNRLKVRL